MWLTNEFIWYSIRLFINWTIFCFLIKEALFSWKKNSRFLCQDTQNGVKRPEKWFIKNSCEITQPIEFTQKTTFK